MAEIVCKKKHVEDLDTSKIARFSYRYIEGQILIAPTSIFLALKRTGLTELANIFMNSAAETLEKELAKKPKSSK